MRRGVRVIAPIPVVAMSLSIAACGSSTTAGPGASRVATPTATVSPVGAPMKVYADPFTGLRDADSHMQTTATLLASGLTEVAGTAGDPGSPAADLRATLTYLLTEHVGLFGLLAQAVNHAGLDADATKSALKALA